MERRIRTVHPVTLTMNLPPLDEAFQLVTNDEPYEQWYYALDGSFSPNRKVDNLVITPQMRVTIPETNEVIQVNPYNGTGWYIMNSDGTWPVSPITTQEEEAGVDYIVNPVNYSIAIKKNVLPESPVVLKCLFVYADPRAAGVLYEVEEIVTLNTNQDSETIYPRLYVDAPAIMRFDPIFKNVDENDEKTSELEFTAQAKWNDADITPDMTFVWKIKDIGWKSQEVTVPEEEILADTFLGYVSGQGTPTLVVDALFSENFMVVCCAKFTYTPVKDTVGKNPSNEGWYVRTVTPVDDVTEKNPKMEGWYVMNGKFLVPTQDTTPQQGVTYYVVTYALTQDETPQPGIVYYTTNGELVPDNIYRAVIWDIPAMDVNTACGGSNVIEQGDVEKSFTPIITCKEQTLTDEQMDESFVFNWTRRQSNLTTYSDEGWGRILTLPIDKCYVPTNFTVEIKPEPYIKGASRQVTCDGQPVTVEVDGVEKIVYSRT